MKYAISIGYSDYVGEPEEVLSIFKAFSNLEQLEGYEDSLRVKPLVTSVTLKTISDEEYKLGKSKHKLESKGK